MRIEIVGNELYIAKKIKNIDRYDIKLLKLFKSFDGYVEVPLQTIIKELHTNNKFVYNYISRTNQKIEKYGMKIKTKDQQRKICILEEED